MFKTVMYNDKFQEMRNVLSSGLEVLKNKHRRAGEFF